MKKTITILAALLFTFSFSLNGIAQDKESKAILDKASAKMEGWKTLKIKFGVTIIPPPDEGDPIGQKGTIWVKDDKYMLDITDQEIYCDGINITSYLREDNECYNSLVEESEDEIMSPTELLTIWEDGYKSRYDGDQIYAKENCHVIYLHPTDPKKSKFHTIKLLINEKRSEVVYVYLKGKDGTNMKYKLVSMERDIEMPDSKFVFNPAEHPGVECYDE